MTKTTNQGPVLGAPPIGGVPHLRVIVLHHLDLVLTLQQKGSRQTQPTVAELHLEVSHPDLKLFEGQHPLDLTQ